MLDQTADQTEANADADAITEDPFVAVALPVVTHLIRFKWLYVVAALWVAVLIGIHPHKGNPNAQQLAGSANGTAISQPASATGAAPASALAPDSVDASGLSTYDDYSSVDAGSLDSSPYGGSDTSGDFQPADDGSGSAPSGADQPPPAPSCSADQSLPVPVATTVVGALATGQATVTGAAGQQPPASPADTAGSAAGCTASASAASAPSGVAVDQPSVLFSPEAFAVLLAQAMGAAR